MFNSKTITDCENESQLIELQDVSEFHDRALYKVPREIWAIILDGVEPVDAKEFALSGRFFAGQSILAKKALPYLEFKQRLAKFNPDVIFCAKAIAQTILNLDDEKQLYGDDDIKLRTQKTPARINGCRLTYDICALLEKEPNLAFVEICRKLKGYPSKLINSAIKRYKQYLRELELYCTGKSAQKPNSTSNIYYLDYMLDVERLPNETRYTRVHPSLGFTETYLKNFAAVLKDPECKITALDLSGRWFSVEDLEFFAPALQRVKYLDFRGFRRTDEEATIIVNQLKTLHCLKIDVELGAQATAHHVLQESCSSSLSLKLSWPISREELPQLEQAIRSPKCHLVQLELDFPFSTSLLEGQSIITALLGCGKIRYLTIGASQGVCSINNKDILALAVIILQDVRKAMCRVTFESCYIEDTGLEALNNALNTNSYYKFTIASECNCCITPAGLAALINLLENPRCNIGRVVIRNLRIENCELDTCMRRLAATVVKIKHLMHRQVAIEGIYGFDELLKSAEEAFRAQQPHPPESEAGPAGFLQFRGTFGCV